ncbi:MAG: DUF2188 domain-containing protein [Methanobrevibacter sp.]|nr:DUF2188 domain-containing protein [Methanobrevibacter sp.]
MSEKDVYVIPVQNGWGVGRPFSAKLSKKCDNKSDAISYGRNLAKQDKSELIILKKNGQIQDRNDYGNNPFPPKVKDNLCPITHILNWVHRER